jgi:hypothetical protein
MIMIKLFLINLFFIGPYFYEHLIFLEPPPKTNPHYIDFNLSKEDIRYVRHYFLNTKFLTLAELPKVPARKNVDNFFNILRNQKSKRWMKAYLYLLTIVPEHAIEEEIGC